MMVSSFTGLHARGFPRSRPSFSSYIVTPAGSYLDFLYRPVIKQAQERGESPSTAVRRPLSILSPSAIT